MGLEVQGSQGHENETRPMTRSASNISRRAGPSNKQLNIALGPPATKLPHRLGLPASRRVRRTEQGPLVLTVGHSTRTLKDFIALLLAHDVKQLIDVRTIPRSRHNPQFNQGRLPRPLQKAGIRYRHMAGLGGLRHPHRDSTNTAWENASFRGFADYMPTPQNWRKPWTSSFIGPKSDEPSSCAPRPCLGAAIAQ
jgi:hypothetical protein